MMNYIKSELYRVFHGREIYGFTGILAALAVLFNVVSHIFQIIDVQFLYGNTSFSYSNIVASPMLFGMMGAIVAMSLYEGNRRNGNLKNTVAFGISRTEIFIGECVVSLLASIFAMIFIVALYILSTETLLEHAGPVELKDLLTEIPAVFLVAAACMISAIVCIEMFAKSTTGIIAWVAIWFFIPNIFFYLGFRFDAVYKLAMWLPHNFLSSRGMIVNMRQCITAWGTAQGMIKCLITGGVNTLFFLIAGTVLLRKREL